MECHDCKKCVCFECGACGCPEKMEWISVKDRLPESQQCVLFVQSGSSDVFSGTYKSNYDYADWSETCNCGGICNESLFYQTEITHWMPLPTPPIDKDSASYFMTQMTQEEFTERSKSKSPLRADFEFNRIHKKD